jgi:hypothetical protein
VSGPAVDSQPTPVRVSGEIWLLHRSDRSIPLAAVGRGRGEDTGTLRRFTSTRTLVPGDLDRMRTRQTWADLLSYTPHRPEGASVDRPLTDAERYTRGTVGLHLRQPRGPLDEATASRLRSVLDRAVPINVRVIVHLTPPVVIEEVYPAGADLHERVEDRYPEIEHLTAVTEAVRVTLAGWRTLHSALPGAPPPADPLTGGVSADQADPTTLRGRTFAPPPE